MPSLDAQACSCCTAAPACQTTTPLRQPFRENRRLVEPSPAGCDMRIVVGAGNGLPRTDERPWDSAFGNCGRARRKVAVKTVLIQIVFIELEVRSIQEALQKDNDIPSAGAAGCAHRDSGVTRPSRLVAEYALAGIQGCLVLVMIFREVGSRGRGFPASCAHLCATAHADRLLTG
jgi:hypothetical protein